jgi:hypothetical protein
MTTISVDSLPAEYGKESGPVRDAESIGNETYYSFFSLRFD